MLGRRASFYVALLYLLQEDLNTGTRISSCSTLGLGSNLLGVLLQVWSLFLSEVTLAMEEVVQMCGPIPGIIGPTYEERLGYVSQRDMGKMWAGGTSVVGDLGWHGQGPGSMTYDYIHQGLE